MANNTGDGANKVPPKRRNMGSASHDRGRSRKADHEKTKTLEKQVIAKRQIFDLADLIQRKITK